MIDGPNLIYRDAMPFHQCGTDIDETLTVARSGDFFKVQLTNIARRSE